MPPKVTTVGKIPRKSSKLKPPPAAQATVAREGPEQRVPVRRTDRDVEDSTEEQRPSGPEARVMEEVTSPTARMEVDDEDEEEEEEGDDEITMGGTITSRDNSDIRHLERLLEKERSKSSKLLKSLKASNRLIVKQGMQVPDPDNIDDILAYIDDSEDGDAVDDEVVEVGSSGFRNGPYSYHTNPTTAEQVHAAVEKRRAEFIKALHKEPWEQTAWQKFQHPENEWRKHSAEDLSRKQFYAMKNWLVVLHQCHVSPTIAQYVFIRQFSLCNINSIIMVDDETFKSYINNLTKNAKMTVPLPAIQCLKALRCWARWFRLTTGSEPLSEQFTFEEAQKGWKRYMFEQNLSVNKVPSPTAPEKFKSFKSDQWKVFRDSVHLYIAQTRGVLNLPLSYLLRPNDEPTTESTGAASGPTVLDLDVTLIKSVILTDNHAEVVEDNNRLYSLLLPLLQHTPAWECVRASKLHGDGRGMWKALLARGDGDEAQTVRKWVAEDVIRRLTLDSSNRGNPKAKFDQFIRTLQGAYNELEDLGEPLTPPQQVRQLVRCLENHKDFNAYRSTILHNADLKNNLENSITHLATMLGTSEGGSHGSTRNVSATTTTVTGRVPKDQWKAMTSEQRKAHLKKMKANPASTTKGESGGKRKSFTDGMSRVQKKVFNRFRGVSTVVFDKLQAAANGQTATPVTPPTPTPNPSAQFGPSVIQQLSTALDKVSKYD
jgi:hypothetical protein